MNEPKKRPPQAVMTASAAMQHECAALRKLGEAGWEIVVVPDESFEAYLRIVEEVRRNTLAKFKEEAEAASSVVESWRVEWKLRSRDGWMLLSDAPDKATALKWATERKSDGDEYRISRVVTIYPEELK